MTKLLPRVLYIAGYSRSGSTLIDMLLNGHDRITATGELVFLNEEAQLSDRYCTCGSIFNSCSLFGSWLAEHSGSNSDIRSVEARRGLNDLLRDRVGKVQRDTYRQYAQSLFGYISKKTGADVVVDSSKSAADAAGRPLALARIAGIDVFVLHLTRSAHATVSSYLENGSNWVVEGRRESRPLDTWRPIVGWTLAHRNAMKVGKVLGADRYLRMSFEEFLDDPEFFISRLGQFIDLDLTRLSKDVLHGKMVATEHCVGGNRIRKTPRPVNFRRKEVSTLPLPHRIGLRIVAGRTSRKLGYSQ